MKDKNLIIFKRIPVYAYDSIFWKKHTNSEVEVCINTGLKVWKRNFLTSGKIKKIGKTYWLSLQQNRSLHLNHTFAVWNRETLGYRSGNKGVTLNFSLALAEYCCGKWLVTQRLARKENPVNFPQKEFVCTKYLLNKYPSHYSEPQFPMD
jgi:hypothetical protein